LNHKIAALQQFVMKPTHFRHIEPPNAAADFPENHNEDLGMRLRLLAPVVVLTTVAIVSTASARFAESDSRSSLAYLASQSKDKGASRTASTKTGRTSTAGKAAPARTRYGNLIAKHARANGVPVKLAHAVVTVESRYNARARGRAGEVGLMQIKPSTARAIGYKGSIKALYDPDTNLRWGMKYLGKAHKLGGGTTCGTILKYNAGHYAKRMNKISARYCGKVKKILASS
jgi:soluble lytic murein transglycosylase-like protein